MIGWSQDRWAEMREILGNYIEEHRVVFEDVVEGT
jgi:hypothetical protein